MTQAVQGVWQERMKDSGDLIETLYETLCLSGHGEIAEIFNENF